MEIIPDSVLDVRMKVTIWRRKFVGAGLRLRWTTDEMIKILSDAGYVVSKSVMGSPPPFS